MILRRLFLALLAWPGLCLAAAALPAADLGTEAPALRAAMASLLDDYAKRLPLVATFDTNHGENRNAHQWSPARMEFGRLCDAELAACGRVLQRQYDALYAELGARAAKPPAVVRDAVLASALVDICLMGWRRDEMGNRCLPSNTRAIAGAAASLWHVHNYDYLFLIYHRHEEGSTTQLENWARQNEKLSKEQKAWELQRVAPATSQLMRRAFAAEIEGRLTDAHGQWSLIYATLSLKNSEVQAQGSALANMARLSARQGRFERAAQWQEAARSLAGVHPELSSDAACQKLRERFDTDIGLALAGGQIASGQQAVEQLIASKCPFATRAITVALAALAHHGAGDAARTLKSAQAACQASADCGYTRSQQIAQVLTVAQADPAAWRKAVAYWNERLAHPDAMFATDIDIVWALAERLRGAGAAADALGLFRLLDRHVAMIRKNRNSPPDMARYDDLTRMRVRLEVAAGAPIELAASESLRGQKLLRQLTMSRWARQLAGVEDAAALAEFNERMLYPGLLRQQVASIPQDQFPLIRKTMEYLREDLTGMEVGFRESYLARLASKQRDGERGSTTYAMPLSFYEGWETGSASKIRALDEHDSYLSWLRVPGGYVGTLLARPSGRAGPQDNNGEPVATQRFIAFSEQDEALLELYRSLLQSGASVVRGARVSAPMDAAATGLMLGKLPLWQLTDGSLKAAASAPSGARRVTEFGILADALYQRLLAPFAPLYQDSQRLIVSPDGALVYLPFETLTRNGVSVLDAIDIGYVQSLDVYFELKTRVAARGKPAAPALLSVADPVYDAVPAASGEAGPMAAITWLPLPGTRTEARAISGLFQKPQLLLGPSASKTSLEALVQRKELRNFQVLHFATHGYVDDERSALVLTPGASAMSAYLSDQEIVQWELQSDLVLLSACNTGIGRRQQGEGVVGLPYAFFMAGNLNTLMSLWPVDDQGTAALIPAFVQRIQQGEDHVTALNNTKRAFARGDHGAALRNPRIWSAFVLYGVPLAVPPSTPPANPAPR